MNPNAHEYLCDAGYPRATPRLKGLVTLLSCVVFVPILNTSVGPHEMTARMERIVTRAQEIVRIVSQPGYDCDRVACEARLKERNHAVHARLATLVAAKTSAGEAEIALSPHEDRYQRLLDQQPSVYPDQRETEAAKPRPVISPGVVTCATVGMSTICH